MDKKQKEFLTEQAFNKLRGRLVRGLSRRNAMACLIDFLTSKELEAITDRSANQISRFKTGKAAPDINDAEILYRFYRLAADSGLPEDNDNDGQQIEDYPLYTQNDTDVMIDKILSAKEQIDLIAKQLARDLMTSQRTVRDFAPRYPIDAKELPDGSVALTDTDPEEDSNKPVLLGKPDTVEEDKKKSSEENKRESDNSKHQEKAEEKQNKQQAKSPDGQQQLSKNEQKSKEKRKNVPEGVRPLRLYRSKNKRGETVWSTDKGKTWYMAPQGGEGYLKQAIGYVGKYGSMYHYLTMRERYLLEFSALMHEKAYRKEIPQNDMETYRKMFSDPESYWILFFKYAQNNMSALRGKYGENVKMFEPHFAAVEDVINWEQSLDKFLLDNPDRFGKTQMLDHSPNNMDM